jgi:hypothetical protein
MTHRRNVEGLRASAQKRHKETVARAEEAIVQLHKQRQPITFPGVAEAAGVSVSWLYKIPEIKQWIQSLRQQQQAEHSIQPPQVAHRGASEGAKDAIITALKQQIKELKAENRELRRQLEVVYGELRQQERGENV